MDVCTTRFGSLETVAVSSGAIFTFPRGVPGFEQHTSFALIDDDRIAPFRCLQSLADPDVGFLVVEPDRIVEHFEFDLPEDDVLDLELADSAPPLVLTILTIPDGDVRAMTANLQAPIVLNAARRLGKQVILADERYPLRYPVFETSRLAAVGSSPCSS